MSATAYLLFPNVSPNAIAFLLFAVVAAGTPGPSNILLTSTGANIGVLRGMRCLFGVTIGMGFMLFVVAFGLGSLVLESQAVLHALKWSGIAFLLWLAWKIATASHGEEATSKTFTGFWQAAAFQWINPKSWFICASAVATFLDEGDAGAFAQSASLGLLFVCAAVPSCFPWLAFGAVVQRILRTERALRTFNITMAALLVGSIALFLR
jgi:threonine/homoserine/homoserine lactone efflux protein